MGEILEAAIEIAYSAGQKMMEEVYGKDTVTLIKPDTTKLTQADIDANAYIFESLRKKFPGHSIMSEEEPETPEQTKRRLQNPNVWIFDPLDGSEDFEEFVKGDKKKAGDFAVQIAYLFEGVTRASAVYLPAHGKMYTAQRGEGAYLHYPGNYVRIHVSRRTLDDSILTISRKAYTHENAQLLAKKFGARGFIREGCRGVRICSVAEGKADAAFVNDTVKAGEWDTCAPELILTEAGGMATDYNGKPIAYNKEKPMLPKGGVFTNDVLHSRTLRAMQEFAPLK